MSKSSTRKLKLILLLTGINLCVLFFILWKETTPGTGNASIDSRVIGVVMFIVFALLFLLMGDLMRRFVILRRQSDKARERMHDAVESLSEAFALFSPTGRMLLCNSRWRQVYPWLDNLELERWDTFKEQLKPHLTHFEPVESEQPGSTSYVEHLDSGHAILASDSRTREGGLACVRTDITHTQKIEQKLRNLGRALEQSPASVMITNTRGIIEYVNPKFCEVSGYSREEAIGQGAGMLRSGEMPDDVYRDLWKTLEKGKEWHGHLLNRRKDGSLFWESASISAVRDEFGNCQSYIAVKEDITQQKEMEEQLKMIEAVFSTSNEAIMVADRDGLIKTINPAFSRITGYTLEEVQGRNPSILSSGRHEAGFYQDMWQDIMQQGCWSGEIWNRRKNGTIYPEWLSVSVVYDSEGNPSEYVAVFSDITQRKNDEAQIVRQAYYDELTELPNRTLLSDRLNLAIATANRDEQIIALLFIDLDRFKYVNDSMGHEYGDDLLKQVAQRLNGCVRNTDTVARFGGDEFVILLHNIKSEADASYVANKLIESLSTPFLLAEREIIIGASIGIAMHPGDADTAETLLRNADLAMYRAKQSGRNQAHFFTAAMQEHANQRMTLEQDLRHALERKQLEVYYQPIITGDSGDVKGVEALLRWHHPERGMIPPDQFIPMAEETGLIGSIGEWVLDTACQQIQQLAAAGHELYLSVNVSERQRDLGLDAEAVRAVLEHHNLHPSRLILEITEGLLLQDSEETVTWLQGFKDLGISLAIDDFGTGYSSLSYLKHFPVDSLKIDREFVRDLDSDRYAGSLVTAIISMAASLELRLIAEGVETEKQRLTLVSQGCRYMQGYLFCPPLPVDKLSSWLDNYRPTHCGMEP
ncbi:EAL domain-containing protein [Marinobacterium sediminicola]|uniref:PAS domain S-box-containing protein/diguanylate cyclase (GGDEF) domain-containing protein n=1 Tax=Marinobacterium sediminicola TaxID=518898 RepID=A0ABY1RWM4_9GAMM|nr:EAL domain-containing protein [Marinobacterium sediminicola]ULG70271.1 EAL domain-containing protein [Marinobacterium sediminicola]SMR69898.1 PAS domain S-box-containing protein/diguanylate cyclase (GGDEF) domain-containing protein [Marinobacterium sediminicola]